MSFRTFIKSMTPGPLRALIRRGRAMRDDALSLSGRLQTVSSYLMPGLRQGWRWLRTSRELTNFTYSLGPLNREYLAAAVSRVTGESHERIIGYFEELETDIPLRDHVARATAGSGLGAAADGQRVDFGRRIGWYAVVRAMKPAKVVETGVDKGLGACVLCAALLRNSEEGVAGEYLGTDIDPGAGYLLGGRYREVGRILTGDSIQSLGNLDAIDVFINDSDHSAEYEGREYATIEDKLTPRAIVLGDNAHVTNELLKFARRTGREFLFFREEPADHWYPGAGIGFCFRRQ